MRKLRRRYRSDCFPTCIAMVADIPHRQALKLVHPRHKKGKKLCYGTTNIEGILTLERLGFKVKRRYKPRIKKISNLKNPAIIRVAWKTHNLGHVVVWDPKTKKIYDPAFKKSLNHTIYLKAMTHIFEIQGKCKAVKK